MSEFQDSATYPQIKSYVLEHTGLKVSKLEELPLTDNWSGFADLLANVIEKDAAVLDSENLPEPPIRLDRSAEEHATNSIHSSDAIENTETA